MFSSRKRFAISFWTAYLIFIFIFMYENKKDNYKNSEKREALVIDMMEGRTPARPAARFYYPQFQFIYDDSVYVSSDQLTWTRTKKPGDKVTVIFSKGKPEEAIIYTFVS